MADSDFLEQRGYCGGFIYLDDTYGGLCVGEVKTIIAVLKRALETMDSRSDDYMVCEDFIDALETMLKKAQDEWNQGCQDCR